MNRRASPWLPVVLGCGLGLVASNFPLWPWWLLLAAGGLSVAVCLVPREERRFMIGWFVLGCALRLATLGVVDLVLHAQGHPYAMLGYEVPVFYGDGGFEVIQSGLLSDLWRGVLLTNEQRFQALHPQYLNVFTYVRAFIFFLFGYHPWAVLALDVCVSMLAAVCYARIAHELVGPRAGRLTLMLLSVWPSMVLWSISGVKDTWVLALLAWSQWIVVRRWRSRYRFVDAAWWLLAHVLLRVLRPPTMWLSAAITLWLLMVRRFWAWRRQLLIAGAAVALVAVVSSAWGGPGFQLAHRLLNYHIGTTLDTAWSNGWSYRIYPSWVYDAYVMVKDFREGGWGLILAYLPYAFWQFLIQPAPWAASVRGMLALWPPMLLWYGVSLCALWGLATRPLPPVSRWVISSWLAPFSLMLSLTGGSVGTLFRHRDQVTPWWCLAASAAICGTRSAGQSPGASRHA